MQISYTNQRLEKVLIWINVGVAALVVATFVSLFGFKDPLLDAQWLYTAQTLLLAFYVLEKMIRTFNAETRLAYWRVHWYEILLWFMLFLVVIGRDGWETWIDSDNIWHFAVGFYLVLQVMIKLCRTTVRLAALGRNPMRVLIISFVVLILVGAGILCLPNASTGESLGFVDALFTATSATCVTGLIVKDTGADFTLMGQFVILTLIQLGGLGIVVFGAVLSLLLGQALTLRESVAMQDLLNANTLNRLSNIIAFIFIFTVIAEFLGALGLLTLWSHDPAWDGIVHDRWFYSIFHSISAFCNAGFGLYDDSLERFQKVPSVYFVIMPLIVLGGMGFGVLYNLCNVITDRVRRSFTTLYRKQPRSMMRPPKPISLQSKIVLSVSLILILSGTLLLYSLEHWTGDPDEGCCTTWYSALFQSVTARTAGFNTIPIADITPAGRLVLIILMFIGGSPGSTAGGMKTVTLAVIVMTIVTTLRKRNEVDLFHRSLSINVVGRAIMVTGLFLMVLFVASLLLTITERSHVHEVTLADLIFEATSALGTVGLTTGITPLLTVPGKYIIILVMLVGRLGPLTLLAALTFDLKPARYSYPRESVMIG